MSKTAIGFRLSASGLNHTTVLKEWYGSSPDHPNEQFGTDPRLPGRTPTADSRKPFPEVATSFTVMSPVTSVTSQPLAESVLIRVGKVSPVGLLQGGIGSVLRLDSLLCAVTGGTCIK